MEDWTKKFSDFYKKCRIFGRNFWSFANKWKIEQKSFHLDGLNPVFWVGVFSQNTWGENFVSALWYMYMHTFVYLKRKYCSFITFLAYMPQFYVFTIQMVFSSQVHFILQRNTTEVLRIPHVRIDCTWYVRITGTKCMYTSQSKIWVWFYLFY